MKYPTFSRSKLFLACCSASFIFGCAYQDSQPTVNETSQIRIEEPIVAPEDTHEHLSAVVEADSEPVVIEMEASTPRETVFDSMSITLPSTKHKKAEMMYQPAPQRFMANQAIGHTGAVYPPDFHPPYYQDQGREKYDSPEQNAVKLVSQDPVSTFSVDVDTGSYTNIRRMISAGTLPPVDAVRIEEMINYFSYDYEAPAEGDHPFAIHTEMAMSPWSKKHALLRVGLQGFEPDASERPAANLVFLLDVSGSMNSPDKLPLLKQSLLMLSKQLTEKDSVAIVVYAGASGTVLEPTKGNEIRAIEAALAKLRAGGSTNGEAGIQLAYQLAQDSFTKGGINRVILATDGDFNVGTSDTDALKKLIERKRKAGISLTTLGFGTGNYNDHLMEQLADVGNGNYAYIDTLKEAQKTLVEQINGTLMTIAKDVKIQIEFNPEQVKEYRLVGYENRMLKREDFNNDKVDAGEIGAGHNVTAIYEVLLADQAQGRVDPLRYGSETNFQNDSSSHSSLKTMYSNELAFIKFRYKKPGTNEPSTLIEQPIAMPKRVGDFDKASQDFRFASSVAYFGETLRDSDYIEGVNYSEIIRLANQAKGNDPFGYRSEFVQLVRLASSLSPSYSSLENKATAKRSGDKG